MQQTQLPATFITVESAATLFRPKEPTMACMMLAAVGDKETNSKMSAG